MHFDSIPLNTSVGYITEHGAVIYGRVELSNDTKAFITSTRTFIMSNKRNCLTCIKPVNVYKSLSPDKFSLLRQI